MNLTLRWALLFTVSVLAVPLAHAEPADTIATGLVFAYGHELEPPYVLEIVDSTVCVNGVQVFPDLTQVEDEPLTPPEKRQRPEPGRSLYALWRKLEAEGLPTNEITARCAAFMEEQEGIDSVTSIESGAFLAWSGGEQTEYLTYRYKSPTMEERCQNQLEGWRNRLESNAVIVLGEFADLGFSGNRTGWVNLLREEIDRARNSTLEELAEENWEGGFLSAKLARLFHKPYPLTED